jgi:hypothetical protein
VVASTTTRRYSLVRELEINLVLGFRVPEDGLTVNGILLGLEEQTPVILNAVLHSIFKALEHRAEGRCGTGDPSLLCAGNQGDREDQGSGTEQEYDLPMVS